MGSFTPLYLSQDYKISIFFSSAKERNKTKQKNHTQKKPTTAAPYKRGKGIMLCRAQRKHGFLIAAQGLILLC